MTLTIAFSQDALPQSGTILVAMADASEVAKPAKNDGLSGKLARSIEVAAFTGGFGKTLDVLTPAGTDYDRVILIGTGKADGDEPDRFARLGGQASLSLGKTSTIAMAFDGSATDCAAFAMGMVLARYRFDSYKTKTRTTDDAAATDATVTLHVADAKAAKAAWARASAIADGTMLARDLVNEPANVLTPKEFAKRVKKLEKLGCDVEVLDAKAMAKLKMRALLGVAQGSRNEPRMAIVKWNGGKEGEPPVAFVGKGVTFDTGGISIKPSAGMEDMKGDMGGAAAVAGLMHALAARKAKVNAIGIVACVENMPDGDAQRPGDIVTSMSGQTIEIINTDAEGRLVLADALWHCKEAFAPKLMIDLATLTGAVLVALGNDHAGLFSNNDDLAADLAAAGIASNEKVWRLPLGKAYDKIIDTKNADMKNSGGRMAGSITAAQFLQRFVGDTPWAHLDVAGTAMGSPTTEISTGWASGFGVRLLDRLVADTLEDSAK
ncbi:leucyl aminopeptidase [Rhizobiaceae bacterium]|nr:leucyl aminopeptidase [Rhizobiaceae bacterium]